MYIQTPENAVWWQDFLKSLFAGNILSVIASYASIISLVLTAYIAWNLRKIRNTYIFRIKAPEFAKAMSKHASALVDYGNDFDNSKQLIAVELTKVDVRARAMEGRMSGEAKKVVQQLRKLIKEYEGAPADRDKFYSVYREMQRVVGEVRELLIDINLE